MALKKKNWDALPVNQKTEVINFVKNKSKIDLETPERDNSSVPGNYSIAEGTTSGGHEMKRSKQLRIYADDTKNIPTFLDKAVKERGTKNRIGGTEAIEAIMKEGNLKVGRNADDK